MAGTSKVIFENTTTTEGPCRKATIIWTGKRLTNPYVQEPFDQVGGGRAAA